MLEDEETLPSLGRVAEASGMSSRTFQRRLNEENRAFKRLLDEVRQDRARRLVADGVEPINRVATRLGYSRPTSLNRSMLRWTGKNPTAFRSPGS
jgi:AraC-like DNA-binding protein